MKSFAGCLCLVTVLAWGIGSPAAGQDVPFNGDFEMGNNGPWMTTTNYPGFEPFVFTGAPLEGYPQLTPYEGTYSMMFYRDDGPWNGEYFHPVPGWYECAYTRQNYRLAPGTYTFSVAGAGFVHHDRYEDQDEDPWGAGVALNIYVDDPDLLDPVFSHDWWPTQEYGSVNVDGQWIYGDKLANYALPGSGARDETTINVPEESDVVVEIIWISKWDTDLDASAIDSIVITGLPLAAAPAPDPAIRSIERLPGGGLRILLLERGEEGSAYDLEFSDDPDRPGAWSVDPDAVVTPLGGGLFQVDTLTGPNPARFFRGAVTP